MKSHVVVGAKDAGRTVADLLRRHFHQSGPALKTLVSSGRVWLGGRRCTSLGWRVRAGQRLEIRLPTKNKPQTPSTSRKAKAQSHGIHICYVDEHIVVVDKPAGLTTVRHKEETASFGARARRYLPPTLVDLLPSLLPGQAGRIRAVHRLDKETSGLVVLARTARAERALGLQFRGHHVERKYLALVRGRAKNERIESVLTADRGDGRRGSASEAQSAKGQHAVTHVHVVEELGDFTLVECQLETGRTHQVRIHLGERGTPLCGETIYDRPVHGAPLSDASGFSRPALHAAYLGLRHPISDEPMHWSTRLPDDMRRLLERLRG
jgi:23S rRNA pseudouridine1911/1915/1917 synthase